MMKTNRMLLVVMFLGALFAREAQAFYNPSTGRWLNRDPIEESSFRTHLISSLQPNDSLDSLDRSPAGNGLNFVENEPIAQLDLLGLLRQVGGTAFLGPRHQNYVEFTITCPICSHFEFTSLDYTYVRANLYALGFTGDYLNNLDELGRQMPGSPEGVNCGGKPVKVRGWMLTRLATQGRRVVDAYQDNLILNYECIFCDWVLNRANTG